jgi:hypothetical protein
MPNIRRPQLDDFKLNRRHQPRHCERSEAIQEQKKKDWIASSPELHAMTELANPNQLKIILLR